MGSSSLSRFPRHLLAASVLMCSVAVHAGGFDLPTIAASHQGTSNANAIEANDPSVLYYNPAGITRLRGTQLSQSASLLLLRGKVEDRGTTGTPDITQPPGTTDGRPLAGEQYTDGKPGSFWPQVLAAGGLFATTPLDDMVTLGLGVFAAGGGNLNYKSDWVGAYHIDAVAVELVNINPSIGIRFDDQHSIGAGLQVIGGHLRQKNQIDVPGIGSYLFKPVIENASLCTVQVNPQTTQLVRDLIEDIGATTTLCNQLQLGILPEAALNEVAATGADRVVRPGSRGSAQVEMYGYGLGYNLGYMFQLNDKTRMGIAYRSDVNMKFRGDLEWDLDNIRQTDEGTAIISAINNGDGDIRNYLRNYLRPDTTAKSDLTIPARLSFHGFHQLSQRIDAMFDVTLINTSVVDEIRVKFSDKRDPNGEPIRQGDAGIQTKWRDSYKVSVGGNYRWDDKLTLKAGFQYDKTPVPSAELRHPGLPDSDRYMYSVGANLKAKKNLSFDAAYSLVVLEDSNSNFRDPCTGTVNENTGEPCTGNGGTFRGRFSDTTIHVMSIQMNQRF